MAWFSHLLDNLRPGRLGRAVVARTTALDRASRKAVPTVSAPTRPTQSEPTQQPTAWQPPPPEGLIGSYRPPGQSGYARIGWWTTHGAELVGVVAGIVGGLFVSLVLEAIVPAGNYGWVPLVLALIGGLGLRAITRRATREGPNDRAELYRFIESRSTTTTAR